MMCDKVTTSFGFVMIIVTTQLLMTVNVVVADSYLQNCDSSLPMVGKNFQIPKTFLAQPGKTIHLKFDLLVKDERIPQNLVVDISLEKKIFWWIPLPCIGKVGSCRYNLPCKSLTSVGLPCLIERGVYHVDGPVRIPAKLSIPSFLARGAYKITAEIKDKDSPWKPSLGCFKGVIDVDL